MNKQETDILFLFNKKKMTKEQISAKMSLPLVRVVYVLEKHGLLNVVKQDDSGKEKDAEKKVKKRRGRPPKESKEDSCETGDCAEDSCKDADCGCAEKTGITMCSPLETEKEVPPDYDGLPLKFSEDEELDYSGLSDDD